MQLKAIEYFIAIVETGSFTKAAEKLFISQPALSQQIKKLEDELGAKLFDRSKHSAELTEVGQLFLQEGKRMIQIYNQLVQRIFELEHPTEEVVRFGISPFYSRYYLPLLLPPLINKYPTLHYEVTENYSAVIEKALIDGKLDFCMVPLLPKNPLLIYEPVYQENILLAVPRDSPINQFAFSANGVDCIDLKVVRDQPFIALKSVQKVSEFSRQLCEQAGFSPTIICETMNWDTLNQLVSTGLGVGFVPDLLINQLEENIRPRYYHLLPNAQRIYTIAYRQGDTLSRSARVMVDVFRKAFNSLSLLQ
ncbi:LysR family transcriptional regulator [Angelakisella massiliensis]|uniref:LysR family transcriptional regulator n=1 Tax=Angelakisella massiliensis TaxID=1871018 RepID=UPI0008F8843B|nr:LysR family transcriptional regulator [Angelakisella massiliensis]